MFIKGKIEDGGGRENKREKMRGERGERGEREEKEEGGDHKNFKNIFFFKLILPHHLATFYFLI